MTIVIFHHAMGLTAGVLSFAEELRAQGFEVHTPDLYQGVVFTDLDAGVAHMQTIPQDEQMSRAAMALDEISQGSDGRLVLVGMSMGVVPAMMLAGQRDDVRAVGALYSFIPRQWVDPWPTCPIQVHLAEHDPFDEGDLDAARAEASSGEQVEVFSYPGDGHLFADPGAPGYDTQAADALLSRVVELARRVGA